MTMATKDPSFIPPEISNKIDMNHFICFQCKTWKQAWSLQKFKVLPVLTAADGDGGVGPPTEKHKFITS